MIHTLILTLLIIGLVSQLGRAFAPAELGAVGRILEIWRGRRAAHDEWVAGADLIAGLASITGELPVVRPPWLEAPVVSDNWRCPTCDQWRCRTGRQGDDCRLDAMGQPTAYAAGHPLPRDGRHSGAGAVIRWLASGWELGALPITVRRELGRLAGAARVPAQLSVAGGRWLP